MVLKGLRLLLGTTFLALALSGQVVARPDAPSQSDQRIAVTYAGRLDTQWQPIVKQPDGRNLQVARYQWTLTWRGRISQLAANPNQKLKVGVLKGTIKYVDATSAEHADCDAAFVAKVETIPMTATVNAGKGTIGFQLRSPVSAEFLRSTSPRSAHCGQVAWWALPDRYRIPYYQLKSNLRSTSRSARRSFGPGGVNREKAVLNETLWVRVLD
jgi:hypothetical protein